MLFTLSFIEIFQLLELLESLWNFFCFEPWESHGFPKNVHEKGIRMATENAFPRQPGRRYFKNI